jgi:hypothetical protein
MSTRRGRCQLVSLFSTVAARVTAWLTPSTIVGADGRPKLYRHYVLGNGRTHGVFLHHFVASDEETLLHDHPWNWAFGVVLRGGYYELRRDRLGLSTRRWLGPGRVNVILPGVFHRVELRGAQPAWTLFVHGRKVSRWGFLNVVTGVFRLWTPDRDASLVQSPSRTS